MQMTLKFIMPYCPTLMNEKMHYPLGPNLNSLQKVKEMLRRLRWRQERMNAIGSGQGWNQHELSSLPENRVVTDILQFVCGEQKNNYVDSLDVEQLVKAMELQQERAQVEYELHHPDFSYCFIIVLTNMHTFIFFIDNSIHLHFYMALASELFDLVCSNIKLLWVHIMNYSR